HGGDRCALERAEKDTAQRVTERRTEASLERLADELTVVVGERLLIDRNGLRTDQLTPVAGSQSRGRHSHHPSARVELDDQLLLDGQRDRLPGRERLDGTRKLLALQLEPLGRLTARGLLDRLEEDLLGLALVTNRDDVSGLHEE